MIPIELFRNQGSTSVTSWPATFGVPLARGVLQPSTHLGVVNDLGQSIPSQIEYVADWEDGSIRWIRVSFEQSYSPGRRYYLTELVAAPPPRWDDIQIVDNGTELLINTAAAHFRFAGGAFPQQIHFDLNRNNVYEPQELLSDNAGGAFYAVRTDGRRGTLTPTSISRIAPDSAVTPTRYAVVRVAGDYLDDQNGLLLAKAIIYYHFHAGKERFRLDHKFIITTHGSAFAEIGIDIPVAVQTSNAAVLDTNGAPYQSVLSAGNTLQMVQREFPRFNNNDSECSLLQNGAVVQLGYVRGSWVDLSGPQTPGGVNWGIAVQVPGFAEQFPKAFELKPQRLKVELWSTKEGAMAWSFSTLDLFTSYFGYWMDAAPQSWRNLVSANGGVGKTHEAWFYTH